MRTRLICLGAVACAVALAQPAAAQVQPAGTGEPLFTNSAQNTQFFEWPAQGAGIDAYRVQYRYYANNAEVASPDRELRHRLRHRVGQLVGRGQPAARRPVRHLRAGQLLLHQRLALLSRRPQLVLDGHDARPPRLHDDRPLQAERGDRARRRRRVHQGREGGAEGRLLRRRRGPVPGQLPVLPVRRQRRRPLRRGQGLHLRLQPGVLRARRRRQVDELHLHRRLRLGREPGARRRHPRVRARRRRRDPRQPERTQPEPVGGQGQPLRPAVRLDRARPRRAGRRDHRFGDVRQGRRSRQLPGAGDRRHVGRRRRHDVELGRQHRRAAAARPRPTRSRRPAATRSA